MSAESNNDNVVKYVDSVYSSNRIKMLKQHSNNKLVNVIVSKYAEICEEDGINFSIDIRNIDFTFIADNDLTAILDNLLENAYEASNASQMKLINMVIEKRNENYVMISVSNSADKKPVYDNGNFITSKKNTHLHGIGLKSVKQIASKYNGDVHLDYDDAAHKFHAVILLKMS